MEIDGHYLDGKTSKRVPATLSLSSANLPSLSLNLKPSGEPGGSFNLDFEKLSVESRLGNTPREISFSTDAGWGIELTKSVAGRNRQLFVTDDNDSVDELIDIIRGLSTFEADSRGLRSSSLQNNVWSNVLYKLESHLGLIVFATVATIAIIWGTVVYGIPKASELIAYQMPGFVSEQLGGSLALLDRTFFDPSTLDEEEQARVHHLVQPYFKTHQALKPKLNFRSGMRANAFALPGGDIVLTDEFVKLVENDEELLAVVFHELGHLEYRHTTRRALQDSMITLLVMFVTGDVASVDLLTALPVLVLDMSYSREFETEADLYALNQLYDADIDLVHFANIMERLESYYLPAYLPANNRQSCEKPVGENNTAENENADGTDLSETASEDTGASSSAIPEFLSTHPATENRVQMVEQYKREHGLL